METKNLRLSVVIPVFNEEGTIAEVIDRVTKVAIPTEIIVVNDGSSDNTRSRLEPLRGKVSRIIHLPVNRGKGAAIVQGLQCVTGDVVVFQDADLEYDPSDYTEMYKLIAEGRADLVLGTRMSGAKPQRCYYFWHMIGNKLFTLIANILNNTTLTDIYTCYKMFDLKIIQGMNFYSEGFEFDAEFLAKVLKIKTLKIYEVPISYYGRTYDEGKKIRWIHAFSVIWTLIKYRCRD